MINYLQFLLIEKSIFRDDLSKTLDSLRFNHEMSITPLMLDCFSSFLKIQEMDFQIWDTITSKEDYELYKNMKQEYELYLDQLNLQLEKESKNQKEIINNYYYNTLNEQNMTRLNDAYNYLSYHINIDINPFITSEELAIWHDAQEKYMENDYVGLEDLVKKYDDLTNISSFDFENLSQDQLNAYIHRLNQIIDEIDEDIFTFSDPTKHQFWINMIKEKEIKNELNDKIIAYDNIYKVLKEYKLKLLKKS